MKIIAHFNATLTIDVPWDEVRPVTGYAFSVVTQLLKDRYQFQAVGQSAVSPQIGLITPAFQAGQFKLADKMVPINQLEFQPSSVVISAATTEQATRFATDVFEFLHKTFEFRMPPADRKRHHTTVIVVDFGTSFVPLFGKINEIARVLNSKRMGASELIPVGFRFGTISAENQITSESQYIFERRAIAPPNENWVFSQAPLDTESHLEVLNSIDALVNE